MFDKVVKKFFKSAGVVIGKDIIVNDNSLYKDLLTRGSLGLGESYMQGKWDSPHLDKVITKLLKKGLEKKTVFGLGAHLALTMKSTLLNMQDRKHAPLLYQTHYNTGNHLFQAFLDPNMIYTCAYFQNTNYLAQAQLDKIRIIGEKLKLKKGDKVLDIGCGWGGTARILSEMFDVEVTGVADTPNQIAYAKKHNASKKVRFIQSDYRDITGKFNKIYNVGFLEAVGPKNMRAFMEQVDGLLTQDGIFLTHTIGGVESMKNTEPWIDRYIFPGGVIPSRKQINNAYKGLFKLRDFEAFGKYYDTTLLKWKANLDKNWDSIAGKFDKPVSFKRMMDYYFLCCAASFRMGKNDLWHLVFTKPGQVQDYSRFRLPKQ